MSTKNVNTTQGTFNQQGMATYDALQPGYRSNMQQFMNDPMKSSFFNTQLQMATRQNQAGFGANNAAMMQNLAASGATGNVPAYMQSNLLRNQRALSGANAGSFNNLLLGANQLRFGATQGAGAFRPLQTGQTETKTQSGLGSWLPQLAGAALGAAGSAMTGGGSSMIGPMMSQGLHMGQGLATQSGNPDNPLLQPTSYEGGTWQ